MSFIAPNNLGNPNANFQATLSAATADNSGPTIIPHHPITCQSKLFYEEDGSFSCEHVTVPPDEPRTQRCLIHSIACLLIELAVEKY